MAEPKSKPAAKKRSEKRAPSRKARLSSLLQRSARDPFVGPSSEKQIERSLDRGTRKTLAEFRGEIDWD